MDFKEIVNHRYATKTFTGEMISDEKIKELLELIRMAPSSFGLQPWKVKVITDKETKEKLLPLSYNQPQIITCSHLLVFCGNTDILDHINKYEKMLKEKGVPDAGVASAIGMMKGFESSLSGVQKVGWSQRQAYIALGNAVNGAKSLGFDSCPMEGFDPEGYKKALALPENLFPCALVAVGIAADNPQEKIRYSKEELFF